jgi:hypothetical protein
MGKTPRILLWDIETNPILAATFSLYPDSIQHGNIIHDWSIICAAWKWLGVEKIYSTSVLDDPKAFKKDINNDYVVVKKLRDVFQDVDILIGHNSKRFDTKKFNARLIFHGLDPLPSGLQQLDTLQEVKKVAAFTSNRLDYLGQHLCEGGKIHTTPGLWIRVLKGDKSAVKEMVTYNKQDVKVLEDVYLKLLPYMKSHPHVGAIDGNDKNYSCPKCGSEDLVNPKIRYSAAGIKRIQKQCKNCHGYTTYIYKD